MPASRNPEPGVALSPPTSLVSPPPWPHAPCACVSVAQRGPCCRRLPSAVPCLVPFLSATLASQCGLNQSAHEKEKSPFVDLDATLKVAFNMLTTLEI